VIVAVSTRVPAGHRLDPRDRNVTIDPGAVATPYRSASQASNETNEDRLAPEGWAAL
jgi:hypothetical protein